MKSTLLPPAVGLLVLACSMQLAVSQPRSLRKDYERLHQIFEKDQPKPEIMLLGVFHFAGEQVDSNTTPLSLRVDMLSVERQLQIADLVIRLARFKPTKIAFESLPAYSRYWDSIYNRYRQGLPLNGRFPDPADESIQVAFRLAAKLGHDKVYPVDAPHFRFTIPPSDSIQWRAIGAQTDPSFDHFDRMYEAEGKHTDSMRARLPLKDYLYYLNSPGKISGAVGRWLVTTKRGVSTDPVAADGFITRYFNRNVRIFSNIQRIITHERERVLVIYGATHLNMLQQLFAASPEYVLRDVRAFLK